MLHSMREAIRLHGSECGAGNRTFLVTESCSVFACQRRDRLNGSYIVVCPTMIVRLSEELMVVCSTVVQEASMPLTNDFLSQNCFSITIPIGEVFVNDLAVVSLLHIGRLELLLVCIEWMMLSKHHHANHVW
jgi:hypothetical protein